LLKQKNNDLLRENNVLKEQAEDTINYSNKYENNETQLSSLKRELELKENTIESLNSQINKEARVNVEIHDTMNVSNSS